MKVQTYYFSGAGKLKIEDTAFLSIAVGNPRYKTNYEIVDLKVLKPYGILGMYSGEQYKEKYFERLDFIGPEKIREEIIKASHGHKTVLLLCHEKNKDECHRRMFAEWWEKKTGEVIEEFGEKKEEDEDRQLSLF